jgi:T-complex protein 1 subunit zeta
MLGREVNSGFFYKTAKEREALVLAERKFIDDRVRRIIAFKKKICGGKCTACGLRFASASFFVILLLLGRAAGGHGFLVWAGLTCCLRALCAEDESKSFVIVNQKGIDPLSLDALARENIFAVRRAKRRNMER